jgi:predicted transposase YdaD
MFISISISGSQDFEKALRETPRGTNIMATLAEQWFEEGRMEGRLAGRIEARLEGEREGLNEACQVVLELFEEQFGPPSQGLVEKLHRIRSYELLRLLRRHLKNCRSAEDFEQLIDKVL